MKRLLFLKNRRVAGLDLDNGRHTRPKKNKSTKELPSKRNRNHVDSKIFEDIDALSKGSVLDEKDQFEIFVKTKSSNINSSDNMDAEQKRNKFWFRSNSTISNTHNNRNDNDDDDTAISSITTDRKNSYRMLKSGLIEVATTLGSVTSESCCCVMKNPCLDDATTTVNDNTMVTKDTRDTMPVTVSSKASIPQNTIAISDDRDKTISDQRTIERSSSFYAKNRRKDLVSKYETKQKQNRNVNAKQKNEKLLNKNNNKGLCSKVLCMRNGNGLDDDEYMNYAKMDVEQRTYPKSNSTVLTPRRTNRSNMSNAFCFAPELKSDFGNDDVVEGNRVAVAEKNDVRRSKSIYSNSPHVSLFDTILDEDDDESVDRDNSINKKGGFMNRFNTRWKKERQGYLHDDEDDDTDNDLRGLVQALNHSGIALTCRNNKTKYYVDHKKTLKGTTNRRRFFPKKSTFRRTVPTSAPSATHHQYSTTTPTSAIKERYSPSFNLSNIDGMKDDWENNNDGMFGYRNNNNNINTTNNPMETIPGISIRVDLDQDSTQFLPSTNPTTIQTASVSRSPKTLLSTFSSSKRVTTTPMTGEMQQSQFSFPKAASTTTCMVVNPFETPNSSYHTTGGNQSVYNNDTNSAIINENYYNTTTSSQQSYGSEAIEEVTMVSSSVPLLRKPAAQIIL